MKKIELTDKQVNCLIRTIEWQLYWRSFVLEPNTMSMLKRIKKSLSTQSTSKSVTGWDLEMQTTKHHKKNTT